MAARVIQGSFIGGRPRLPSPLAQPQAMLRLPGPPAPAFAGRSLVAQSKSLSRLPGPPAPAFAGRSPVAQRHGAGDAFSVDPGQLGLGSGGGRALPEAVRGKMEAALGADFSGVRVYLGPQAERIGAIAFTLGTDIYFAPGRFQPETAHGQQLLGHELAHVVQQRRGRVRNPIGSGCAVVQDYALEAEADRLGRHAAAHRVAVQAKVAPEAVQSPSAMRTHSTVRHVQLQAPKIVHRATTGLTSRSPSQTPILPVRWSHQADLVQPKRPDHHESRRLLAPIPPARMRGVGSAGSKGTLQKKGTPTGEKVYCNGHVELYKLPNKGGKFVRRSNDGVKGFYRAYLEAVELPGEYFQSGGNMSHVAPVPKYKKKETTVWELEMTEEQWQALKGDKGQNDDGLYLMWPNSDYPHLTINYKLDQSGDMILGEAHYSQSKDDGMRVTYRKTSTGWEYVPGSFYLPPERKLQADAEIKKIQGFLIEPASTPQPSQSNSGAFQGGARGGTRFQGGGARGGTRFQSGGADSDKW